MKRFRSKFERNERMIENVLRDYHGKQDFERVDPRPNEAMTALAVGLTGNKALFEELNTRDQQQKIAQILEQEAMKREITLQQLLAKHQPKPADTNSIYPAYKADLERYHDQYQQQHPFKTSPYQFTVEQTPFYGNSPLSSSPSHDLQGNKLGGLQPLDDAEIFQNRFDVRATNWFDTESVKRVSIEGDSIKIRSDDTRNMDEQIRDLIIASELRWGTGKYHFHGSDAFKARAMEILKEEGHKLRIEAARQAREAAILLQQTNPERYETLQAYPDMQKRIQEDALDIKQAEKEAELPKFQHEPEVKQPTPELEKAKQLEPESEQTKKPDPEQVRKPIEPKQPKQQQPSLEPDQEPDLEAE